MSRIHKVPLYDGGYFRIRQCRFCQESAGTEILTTLSSRTGNVTPALLSPSAQQDAPSSEIKTYRATLARIAWTADAGRQFNPGTETMRDLFMQIRDMARVALEDAR